MPIMVMPRSSSIGIAAARSSRAAASSTAVSSVGRDSVCERVAREKSVKRMRRTTVRPRRPARRMRRLTRSTRPTRAASRNSGDHGRRPNARCAPTERRRRRGCTRRGSRLWASACSLRPAARPTIATRVSSSSRATSPNGGDPVRPQPARGGRADAPQALDRQRVQEGELALRRDDQQAVRLGDAARHLGQELGAGDADGDRQADLAADGPAQAKRDLDRGAGDPLHPAHVQERLVDREALDQRRRLLEDGVDGPAGLGVGGHPRRHHDRLRAERAVPGGRPWRCGCRTPGPRSLPPARPRRRRSPAGRAGRDRRAARPTRRTHRDRRAGSSPGRTRTYVRRDRAAEQRGQAPLFHAADSLHIPDPPPHGYAVRGPRAGGRGGT